MAKSLYGTTYRKTVNKNKAGSQSSESNGYELTARQLLRTRPWVRFISVLTFLGLLAHVFIGAMAAAKTDYPLYQKLLYFAFAGLSIFPAASLWIYASRITRFVKQPSEETLAAALGSQRFYWSFIGICGVTAIIACCVGLLLALAFSKPETWFYMF